MKINFTELHCELCEPNLEFIRKYPVWTTLGRCSIHGITVHWLSHKENENEKETENEN